LIDCWEFIHSFVDVSIHRDDDDEETNDDIDARAKGEMKRNERLTNESRSSRSQTRARFFQRSMRSGGAE